MVWMMQTALDIASKWGELNFKPDAIHSNGMA